MPGQGKLVIDDLIRGRVEFNWANEQDHVVQRADGTCLYHLANVVDDQAFEITHVIRAEEHLSNTPRQIFIVEALGYPRPAYAHLPFVAEPGSHNKLSKRKLDKYLKNRDFADLLEHGRKIAQAVGHPVEADAFNPVIVDFYQSVGFLPEAVVNYLALLGWSLDDRTEHFSRDDLIAAFSLERVNKAPASFDPKKLMAFEERHFQLLPPERKVDLVMPFLEKAGLVEASQIRRVGQAERGPTTAEITCCGDKVEATDGGTALRLSHPTSFGKNYVSQIVAAAGDRIKVAGDVLDFADFFQPDDRLPYDEKAVEKNLRKPGATDLLTKFLDRLATVEPFDAAALEALMQEFVAAEGIKIGQIIHPLRVAVTGRSIGFGLFDTLAILGRERCLRRIELALSR